MFYLKLMFFFPFCSRVMKLWQSEIQPEKIFVDNYNFMYTVCLKSLDQIYVVTYYIKWVRTSWAYSIFIFK